MIRNATPGRMVVAVLLAVFLASFVRNIDEAGDFRGYLEVGELVLGGSDIYADARPGVNTWPPLFSVLCVPLALSARVSLALTHALWLILNGAVVWGMLHFGARLVYGRPLAVEARPGTIALASGAVLGPLVLTSRFVLGNLDRLQINMAILLCCMWGCVLVVRGRPLAGGVAVGVAAAVKVLPVFLVPYFAWKRWWRACAGAVVAGSIATVAPVVVFGRVRWWAYFQRWLEIASGGWPVRKGNQSVYAMIDRFYSHRDALSWPDVQHLVASDDPWVAVLVYGLLVVIVLIMLVLGRGADRAPSTAVVPVEVGIVLVVAMLFSPLAWKHYFVFFLPGYFVLWRAAFSPEVDAEASPLDGCGWQTRRRLVVVLAVAFALTTLTVRGVVGRSAAIVFQSMSALTFGGLVLLGGLLYLRAALRGGPARG